MPQLIDEKKNVEILSYFGVEVKRNDYEEAFYINDLLPNPDKVLGNIGKTLKEYERLLYDPHIFALVQGRKSGVMSLLWDVDRGNDEREISTFCKDILSRLDLRRIMSEILDAPLFGFKPLEIYWEEKNGQVVPLDVVGKPSYWFQYDIYGNIKFFSVNDTEGKHLTSAKWLIAKYESTYNNPYGTSILSKCWWMQNFKSKAMQYWVKFNEKFGSPHLIGKMENITADKSDIDALMLVLQTLIDGGRGVIPSDTTIEALNAGNSFNIATYKDLIDFCNSEISKALLSHSAAADSTPGRLGNENQSESSKQLIVLEQKRLVEYWINELLKRTVKLNYGDVTEMPIFELYEEEDVDMNIAQRDALLINTKTIIFTKEYYQDTYGLKSEYFDIIAPEQASAQMGFAEGETEPEIFPHKEQKQIATGKFYKQFAENADKMVTEAIKLIQKGKDYNEVEKILFASYPKLADSKIQEVLARAILAADTMGRLSEDR